MMPVAILNVLLLFPWRFFNCLRYRTFETTAQIPEGVSMSLLNAAATSVFQEAHIHRLGDTVSLVLTLDTNGNGKIWVPRKQSTFSY